MLMNDVYVQSWPYNLTFLWLPIGGSEAQVRQPCPSRVPRAARSPHWQHAIRQPRKGDASSSCFARRPDTDSKPKIVFWERWAKEIRQSDTTRRIKSSLPPFLFHQMQLYISIPLISFTQSGRTVTHFLFLSLCLFLSTLRCCTHPEIPHSALVSPFVSYLLSPYVSPPRLSHKPAMLKQHPVCSCSDSRACASDSVRLQCTI